jgi:(E)-4-hydroxy-3-methylbut-2-enyl-diphosphate synthase
VLDLEQEGQAESAAALSWKGQGKARTPLLASGSDPAALAGTLAHVEGVRWSAGSAAPAAPTALAQEVATAGKALWLEAVVEGGGVAAVRTAVDRLVEGVAACREAGARNLLLALRASSTADRIHAYRLLAADLAVRRWDEPLVLVVEGGAEAGTMEQDGNLALDTLIDASISLGSLLCDGIGDAVYVAGAGGTARETVMAFNILQAAGTRLSKTDYVACPSCGRTLFDLQSTTERIKKSTAHLTGVKIAIMGCIVNGPGEMADADFGYVGGSPGHVNLYVGKECVERNVPEGEADARLIALIKARGRWVEEEQDTQDA